MTAGAEDLTRRNRRAWEVAATKYVVETDELVRKALADGALLGSERAVLAPRLASAKVVVHLQSGHGIEDLDLAGMTDAMILGVDFSSVTTAAAARRANQMDRRVHYLVADALDVGLRAGSADLVYTGKGALMWLPDIRAWADEIARLLRRGGHLFLHEAHPAACLWSWDIDEVRIRPDRSYFAERRTNDTFPASAIERFAPDDDLPAIEWQWTLADILNAITDAGLDLLHLDEHPEPFWRPTDSPPLPAWSGRLPNAFSLLARRPALRR